MLARQAISTKTDTRFVQFEAKHPLWSEMLDLAKNVLSSHKVLNKMNWKVQNCLIKYQYGPVQAVSDIAESGVSDLTPK